jgi:alpha-2-macroglobulin
VQSPFGPAEGLLTISRDGLLRQERFRIDGPDHTLNIPIVEAHLPNLHLRVDLVGSAARTDDDGNPIEGVPDRPAYATGSLNLSIPPHSRTLSVEAVLEESALAPGGATTLNVTVRDANGQPVPNAELAAVVVDEAVLSLTAYQLRNPLEVFYRERPSLIEGYHNRASILLVNPLALQQAVETETMAMRSTEVTADMVDGEMMAMEEAEAPMAAAPEMAEDADMEDGADPIAIRQDFNPLATFAPAVRTDGSGQAQVAIQLPDNLTRYRVMVVAVTDKQFGTAESNLTARLPLMVRPSAPRFLNFGDQFELPIVVQNQTNSALTVDVALRVSNLELLAGAGQQVTVPANDRVEVRFPARAEQPGTARFQVAVAAADYADAASGEWPVYTPATTEAFATYGVLDGGAVAQPVQPPTNVFPQFGGLEIGTSSTALQALTDAVLYLHEYPYDSAEPLASRIMAVAALRDVLEAFSAEGLPQPAELEQAVQRDIELLQGLQNNDGGFPVWERHRESWPYHTIYAAHALHVAQEKGFAVSTDGQQRALSYLRQIEQYYPDYYGPEIRRTLSAYALYVRDLLGDRDVAKAQSLLNEAGLENLSLEAVAWLWPTLADQPVSDDILRHFNNRAVETAAAANFITGYSENDYLLLHSNRRADAVILDALIDQRPESDLIPKVVNGLLAHRERGRWGNTQENTFVLLALDRYFRTFESVTPDFVARFWLGEAYVAEHTYVGRTTERNETLVPMEFLMDSDMADLIVGMEGNGRLYYRLGMRYAPTDLQLPPLDRGFVVQRTYTAVDDPDDVYQDDEGVWHIRAGARVRVEIQMVATSRRYHVALVDPLPAGLEIINPDLAVTESIPADPTENRIFWWWGPWYQHQNLRDARAEAFTTLLWDGVYSYSYVARATTPGTFIVPPAKAEEMYTPEVFGRSGSDVVVVE